MSLFDRAIQVINERGHTKYRYEDRDGGVCMKGALHVALTGRSESCWLPQGVYELLQTATGSRGIVAWNDEPGRPADDVFHAFKRAAELAEAEGIVLP